VRLWRRAVLLVATGMLALHAGGCSYRMGSMFGDDAPEHTGATPAAAQKTIPATQAKAQIVPSETDLALAKVAVYELMSRGNKDASQPWENPRTGARGTVTALNDAYTQEGFTCRDFLASYVLEGAESWLQGEACRVHQGEWEVKTMRPWKRT
jgi:surface antigen